MKKEQKRTKTVEKLTTPDLSGFQLGFAVRRQVIPNEDKFVPTDQMWQT